MQSCESVARSQRQAFHKLLRHAWLNSPFYRDLYSSTGIKYSALGEITPSDLPLIDKKVLMDNFDRAVTDTRLRKRDLERWMYENRNPAASYLNEFVAVHSSGTSGHAGVFVYSQTERRFAGSIVASQLPPPANYGNGRTKAAFCIIADGNRSAVSRAVRMPSSIYETLILSVLDSLEVVARKLNDFQPHQLHGYASSVHQLSRHALSGKLKISPQRILVSGDKLTTGMAMAIRRAWDVPIYDFYTASESSCIAIREANDAAMNVLAEVNLLEVPDAENRGTEDDRSGRLVLTNLFNHTLPIIRYSLGDEVTLGKPTDHAPGGTIKNLRGRTHDRLSVTLHDGGEEGIEAIVFDQLYVPGLERLQITSVRPDFVRIEYVATDNLDSMLRREFQRILDSKGAARTKFEIHRVTRIAIDPQTGKSPLIRTQDAAILDRAQEAGGTREQPRVTWRSRQNPSPVETEQPVRRFPNLPLEQQAIRAKCFHPSGEFEEFPKEDLETSIPHRFEKIVKRYAGRIAVRAGSQTVTYAELNAMANRVARAIVNDRGSDAEAVGLFFEKGIPLMAAMLGVLKSGKFFILLDPSVPIDRMLATLDNSEAHLILTGEDNFELTGLASMSGHQVMEFNSIDLGISTENLRMPILPSALAYIIYTSGSTGVPKGVVKTHQDQLHTVMLRTNANHICLEDRIALLPSGTANAVANTFLALLNGAALLPFDVNKNGVPSLANWLSDQRVSICQIASPLFRRLCEILTGKEDFSALRILRMRSESVQQSDFILYQKHFPPSCLFLNGLSTTETSVLTEYLMDQRSVITGNEIPVGYEMEGTEVLLLDDDGRGVGFNLIGEIVVGSKYLSPGYWNNPELTATKFKPDPHNREKRLYYTGDLGLVLPDGCLVHKGRKDFRVKIRGYGVELSEIEKALERHPAIKETIVLAPRITSGEARLVAYFTCHGEPAPSVSELRSYLKEKLPDFMIPSAFVRLETLPLTPNGKVNRLLLPEPGSSRPDLDTPFVAPRTLAEERLASIWAEVLSLEQVGIHDNFFDLGGHSLAVTRVVSQIIKQFQLEIPVQYFFQSPTVAALVTYVERAALGNRSASGLSVKPVSRDGTLPLSFSQERLWFLDQLEPDGYTYNLLAAYRLNGQVNITALEQSINEIIRRHEVLRTVFKSAGDQPEQIILPSMTVKILLLDLRGFVSEEERQFEIRRLCKEEAQRPFDLARGPLLRVSLLQLADEEYLLLRAMHHIVIDGWSGGVLFRELAQFYEAFSNRQSLPLADLPTQYADFATWQRQWLQGETLETHLSYWKKNLQNIPTLQLTTDLPRPAIQTSHGAHQSFVLSETLSAGIKSLSHRHGVTLFTVLLAAFQTLLARYTGQTDIVIGSPIAGRNRGELDALIGFFLNMLALRVDLSGNPTFLDLLGRTRKVCLEALAHQDLPFEKLVEELHTKRDLSHHPLFQVTFGFRNTPKFSIQLAGLEAEEVEVDSGIARFDINLFMEEERDHFRGYVNYNTDLFNPDTIRRLIDHFKNLLESVVRNPGERIFNLSMLSETERHQLLVAWNDTKRDYPKDQCIHKLFETQVEKTPDAIALVFEDQQLTYRELNNRANQLAHYLQKLGVGPEAPVGICVERSVEMIVGLLGILKAGGAYVPLDPSYPKERLDFMLEDARVGVVLTQHAVLEELIRHQARVICLDRDWSEIEQESEENPGSEISSENLAYVIYTSGSTGNPKGVEIQHRSVVNFLNSMQRHHWLNDKDILLAVTTLSFDIAGLELYLPLTVGARSVIVSREIAGDGVELARKVNNAGATVMQATPTTWRMLLDSGWQPTEHLKILCGGEALTRELATPLLKNASSLWNMYGPTETTIWSTAFQVSSGDGVVSLGRPIDNTQVYLLDKHRNPVPIGVSGEMFIGGDGLARGYRNRPDLVQEKFLDNPFSGDPKSLLYRTGDLARYLPDGNIEFLGRIDHQVKIRGFRIELGEIEATLARHPSVREAVVLALEDDPESKQLVGYIVANKVGPPTSNDLRVYLRQTLPEYMTPSRFTFLEALPLTPNGKVDRRALPVPAQLRSELDGAFSEPRTADEERLAKIWAEVLKLDKVGIHDNFFELGGHSLLATQVMARIRGGALSIELPLRRLFECPTIQELAKAISAEHQTPQTRRFPSIAPASRDGDLPLSFAQQRLWFIDQLEPESSVYNVPGAWRLSGPLDLVALERSVNEIVRRHEVLRTNFVTVDGQPLQRIRPSMALALDLIHLVELVDKEKESAIKLHVREEFREPFDLVRGPLLRAKLLRLAEDDHVLMLTMHHIVSDGWSVGVLFREISLLYQAFMAGGGSPLEDLSIQYADYAVWQRDWLKGDVLEGQLGYWKRQLENLPITQLPTDRPRPPVQRYRGARARVHFDAALTNRLLDLSRGENATLYMTLLAAFQVLLGRYSGQEDIPVGSPIAGRTRSELERLIGFFANTLVLRGDLSGNPTFREFLHRTRDVALEAYAHQDLPFEKLVEDLHPRRDLNISPLFQVMFVLQNDSREDLKLEGLTASSISVDGETAKFDLLLSLRENKLGLAGTLEYDTDLFESTTIDRILAQFETLLRGIVANPDQRLLQLPLLTDRERRQLLAEWNETTQEYPKHLCVHQLFERQAETRPDEIAIVFEDRQMTYRELDVGSNQLAHFLRKHGVGAESVVGVCLERSPEMILAVLAILKAGGAYLPLDPSYPTERLGLMVERGGASIIVTQKSLVSRIPTGEAVCCCLDNLDQILTEQKQESLSSISSPENAAYVLFTSGSTGVPKGVLMEHRPLVNLLSWQAETFASRAAARTLQFAPLSFDVSFQEIFSALCFGGTLVIIGEAERRDAKALWALLNEKAVERMFLPFIALQQLAEASQDDAVTIESLREIITAGEQLQITQSIADLFARLPDCRLCNQYGPTESHVVTSFALGGDPADWPKLPPIGRPIANNKVYILDRCLQPVPIGVIGELYIGGDSLARGYLDQPELSREKFISNPFIKKPGARLYKTGDLARYHADGNIQFVGRIDDQVKVRGFRIEPGEIETILCRHPEVLECVVSAREDATGGKRLVAHIVAGTAHDLDSRKLRDFLKEKLPEYMIPNAFVFLDSLPLTASGKVDRRALPAPDGSRPDLAEAYLAPRNRTEELLAKIWAEVLKLERIGIHDNFFDLGGHSLLATQVASRIREALRIELPLRALFETPTVAALSNHIEAIRCAGDEHQRAIQEVAEQTEETIL